MGGGEEIPSWGFGVRAGIAVVNHQVAVGLRRARPPLAHEQAVRYFESGLSGSSMSQSGLRIEGGRLATQACNWAATATAVRWSRRASLECLRTKAELNAKARSRIRTTAAKP